MRGRPVAPNAEVLEAHPADSRGIVDVAPVEYGAMRELVANDVEVRAAEFLPLGDDREHVGPFQGLVALLQYTRSGCSP